jgi:hypothetical protein
MKSEALAFSEALELAKETGTLAQFVRTLSGKTLMEHSDEILRIEQGRKTGHSALGGSAGCPKALVEPHAGYSVDNLARNVATKLAASSSPPKMAVLANNPAESATMDTLKGFVIDSSESFPDISDGESSWAASRQTSACVEECYGRGKAK